MTGNQTMKNITFLINSFKGYSQLNPIWLLYLAAVLFILIAGTKKARQIFLIPLGVQLLTIYNPLFIGILVQRFGFGNRYLRFFWMIPFFLTVAYAATYIIMRFSRKSFRIIAFFVSLTVICLVGKPVFGESDLTRYRKVENEYFTFDDVVQLKEILHGEGIEFPRVVFDGWLMCNYRTYDPAVRGDMSRMSYQKMGRMDSEEFQSDPKINQTAKDLYGVCYYQDTSIPVENFKKAVTSRNINYIVVFRNSSLSEYMKTAGMTMLGGSANYEVWRL